MVAGMLAMSAASAAPESFQYFSASAGNITADFTVDVVGGVAVSGSGSFSSTALGSFDLLLLTSSSVLPAGDGSINPTPGSPAGDLGSGFTWHGVAGSGGADFIGDAVVNSSPNYLDDYGLIFAVVDRNTNAIVGGFNPWANSDDPAALYATNLSVNGTYVYEGSGNGVLTAAAVPESDTCALMLVGLGLVGFMGRRRRISHSA